MIVNIFLLFGRGTFSLLLMSVDSSILFPRQFPFFTFPQRLLITLKAWVFRQKSRTLGLSCAPPLCRWQPKNFSKGSWHSLWLKNTLTPGRVKRYSTSSMNEWAVKNKINVNNSYIKFITSSFTSHSQAKKSFST